MANFSTASISIPTAAAIFLLVIGSAQFATAAEPPADLCSLLPASVVSKTLGVKYDPPVKTVAPRPYANTVEGADCNYQSHSANLLFRAYADPSASASKDLFARLKAFFGVGSTDVSGLGDEAYLDTKHGLHVRKGRVRFFLSGSGTDEQLKNLASGIAAEL